MLKSYYEKMNEIQIENNFNKIHNKQPKWRLKDFHFSNKNNCDHDQQRYARLTTIEVNQLHLIY